MVLSASAGHKPSLEGIDESAGVLSVFPSHGVITGTESPAFPGDSVGKQRCRGPAHLCTGGLSQVPVGGSQYGDQVWGHFLKRK